MQKDEVILEVEDDGCGMDPEFVARELFRPFRSGQSKGFGLGAYQVREIVRSLGGRLDVHSVPQQGTTMKIVLPASGDVTARADASQQAVSP